jgi:Flagellar hook-length control protein FliK
MSDRVEERRQQEVHDQKRLQNEKTAKEKEVAAQKFKTAFQQKTLSQQKNETHSREQSKQKNFSQNMFMARQGIAGRSQAERLMKSRDEGAKVDRDLVSSRDEGLKNDHERLDADSTEARDESLQQTAQSFDAPVQRDERKDSQDNSGQQGQQMQGQSGHQSGGQGSGEKDKDGNEETRIGGIKASPKGAGGVSKTDDTQNAGKIAIGKTMRAQAAERIPQAVLQGLVEKVAVMAGQGMQEFQIQLKDDVLGGGTLRVTLSKDKKLKIAFTLKEASAKNLLASSKGVLMRMFDRKGITLESLDIKLRGEA